MRADLTMETNNWVVEDPAWANYSKCVCTPEHYWTGYYGTDFFLKSGKTGFFHVTWPNIAEHFYSLQWEQEPFHRRAIFASYSLSEIQRFIDTMSWPWKSKRYSLSVTDEVTKKHIPITDFIGIQAKV